MPWQGLALALAAACAHTVIDSIRKSAAASIPSDHLVTLVYILDAIIAVGAVTVTGGFRGLTFQHPWVFSAVVVSSSALLFFAKFLYQLALRASPLSLTIPYLSFTPAILVVTAFVLLGEVPTLSGLCGVVVVTFGGYLLSLQAAPSHAVTGSNSVEDGVGSCGAGVTSACEHVPAGCTLRPNGSHLNLARFMGSSTPTYTPEAKANPISDPESKRDSGKKTINYSWVPSYCKKIYLPRQASSGMAGILNGVMQNGSSKNVKLLDSAISTTANNRWEGGGQATPLLRPGRLAALLLASPLGAMAQEPGTLLMLGVAALWSVTASLDKLGVLEAPSVAVYCAMQRGLIGAASLMYCGLTTPREAAVTLKQNLLLLLFISLMELAAVALFLLAVQFLLVSYVVAIKRSSILMSVLAGRLLFRESIRERLPYVLLMLCGMTFIVLEPHASTAHHAHSSHNLLHKAQ